MSNPTQNHVDKRTPNTDRIIREVSRLLQNAARELDYAAGAWSPNEGPRNSLDVLADDCRSLADRVSSLAW